MQFLELPIELAEKILVVFVQDSKFEDAFAPRETCKFFNQIITHELLTSVPAEKFQNPRYKGGSFTQASDLWASRHFRTFLLNCACGDNPNVTDEFPAFLRRAADNFLDSPANWRDPTALEHRVLENLIGAVLATEKTGDTLHARLSAIIQILDDRPFRLKSDRVYEQELRSYLDAQVLDIDDKFAAAAAVGDLELLSCISESADLTGEGHFFGSPFVAATASDKLEALQFLLNLAEQKLWYDDVRGHGLDPDQSSRLIDNIGKALHVSVKKCQERTIRPLLHFLKRFHYPWSLQKCDNLIEESMRQGCVRSFESFWQRLPVRGIKLPRERGRVLGCIEACKYGHAELVEYLLQNGHMEAKASSYPYYHTLQTTEDPLIAAVSYSRVNVAQVLLRHGASIDHPQLLSAAVCAKEGSRFLITEFLLDHGAEVNQNVIKAMSQLGREIWGTSQWPKSGILTIDRSMTLIFLAVHVRWNTPRITIEPHQRDDVARALKRIVMAKLSMPSEPMEFLIEARNVHHWYAEADTTHTTLSSFAAKFGYVSDVRI